MASETTTDADSIETPDWCTVADIKEAMADNNVFPDRDNEFDDPTVEDVAEAVMWIENGMKAVWADLMVNVMHDEMFVVFADGPTVFGSTESIVGRDLSKVRDVDHHEMTVDVVKTLHRNRAEELVDHNWGFAYPLIVGKAVDEQHRSAFR